jgi:DNA-binding MarR family transcriptional regulator
VSIDEADKRTRRLKLTVAGRALLVAAVPIWKQTHAIVEAFLPRANSEELRVDLRVLS